MPHSVNFSWSFITEGPAGQLFAGIDALLTNAGRHYLRRRDQEGLAFGNWTFQVGGGGFDPDDPLQVIAVDPEATTLIDPVFGPADVTDIKRPNDKAVAFYCRLEKDEANYELGEIAIFAEVLHSPADPDLVGTVFMYAHAHIPGFFKTEEMVAPFYVCVQG